MDVSVFGSWARPTDWYAAFINLSRAAQKVSYEVVVAGPNKPTFSLPPNVTFIHTDPDPGFAYCAQFAERLCQGETIMQVGDDCRLSLNALDNMYLKFKHENDYKCMIHPRWGTGPKNDLTDSHPYLFETPSPTARYGFPMWSKRFFDELGGYDRRFRFGPGDADIQLRAYAQGGRYVYAYDAFLSEDTTAQGGTFGGTFYQKNGSTELQNLIWRRWYSNGEQYGGTLLSEPRTPFEPIEEK